MSQPLARSEATSAPRPGSKADRLAPIAEAVLRGAANGLCGGFETAELWLLDDASRSLRLTARWSADGDRAMPATRAIADAPADVAALAGGAVVLEESNEAVAWELHAPIGAAIGLPVASDTTIHGVMWLLGRDPRVIGDAAVELAEVVAGRLALEVERLPVERPELAEAVGDAMTQRPVVPTRPESDTSEHLSPTFPPESVLIAPVEAAAWSASHTVGLSASGCWELADGRLLALAAAAIDSPDSSSANQRSAVEWLMEEAPQVAARSEDAGLLLTLLNRRLQDSPLAGEGLAVGATIVDAPENADAGLGGRGTYAFAGPVIALSVRAASTESHAGDLVPLGWTEPQSAYASRPFELAVRQRLVLVAGDPRLTSPLIERRLGDVFRAATADAHRAMTAEGCLRRLATAGTDDVLAAVALRRE